MGNKIWVKTNCRSKPIKSLPNPTTLKKIKKVIGKSASVWYSEVTGHKPLGPEA